MAKTLQSDLTSGSVMRKLLSFAWPLFVGNLLMTFYNVVDTLVVGLFTGSEGISAVTTGGQLMTLITGIGMGFANGGQVLISQLKGANDEKALCKAIGSLFSMNILAGILFGVLGALITPVFLRIMNTPPEAWEGARQYMLVTSYGVVVFFMSFAVSAVMRGLGDSKRPMIFIGVATVMNMILDVILVGPCGLGAFGAAIATIFAIFCSVVYALFYLYRRREQFAFDFKLDSFLPRFRWIRELLKLGVPMALQSSVISISIAYVIALVNVYGVAASSAVGIGGKLVNICCMPYYALGTAASAMCGQSVGAGKLERVKETVDRNLIINMCVFAVTTLIIFTAIEPIIWLFDKNEEVIEICKLYMRLHVVSTLGLGLFTAQNAACMGVGNTTLSAIAYLVDGVVLRLALLLLFTYVFEMGLFGIILATAVAPMGAEVIFGTYYWGGFWRKHGKRRFEALHGYPLLEEN